MFYSSKIEDKQISTFVVHSRQLILDINYLNSSSSDKKACAITQRYLS